MRISRLRTAMVIAAAFPAALAALGSAPAASAQPAAKPAWHLVKTIKAPGFSLSDVTALAGDRAWVSGSAGTPSSAPLFLHRSGGRWVKLQRPAVASGSEFGADVSANADSNVWGAIANGSAVDHWNGHGWHRFSFSASLQVGIDGVLAFGKNRARVFTFDFNTSQPAVNYYNGHIWTARVLPAAVDAQGSVNDVSASSDSNIWTWSYDPNAKRWQTLHFDGKTWTVVKIPTGVVPSGAGGAQILALSPANVWATVSALNSNGPVVLLHWNGAKWQKVGGAPAGELTGPLASDGQGGVWLYAAKPLNKAPFLKPFYLHYLKGKWTTAAAPTSPLGLVMIQSLALIPGSSQLWAVGTIQKPMTNLAGVIEKFGP